MAVDLVFSGEARESKSGLRLRGAQQCGEDYCSTRIDPERETRRLVARLQTLGHAVTLGSTAA